MVAGAWFTGIDLRTRAAHFHQQSSTQTQQTDVHLRATDTRGTSISPKTETIRTSLQDLRKAQQIGNSLGVASTQQTGVYSRAVNNQWMNVNLRVVAIQKINISPRAASE